MPQESLGLVQGTVDVLILRALTRDSLHGYAISQWINDRSNGALAVEDAALYQGLHRLERKGWVDAEWGISDTGRRARFYELTPAGRKRLKSDVAELRRYVAALFSVLESA
jgi:PadR family transcriptional regulator PadR